MLNNLVKSQLSIFVIPDMNHINPSIKKRLDSQTWVIKPLSYYIDGIINKGDFYILSEGITLLESEIEEHKHLSLQLLKQCYLHRQPSWRLGITGSPGVGKSTFIDNMAGHFTDQGHKVGILTIDPSSKEGKGSILGDKTRMEELMENPSIFIRPSPSNMHLGGVNRMTSEAVVLCEAAGLTRILIETVGVGQSEIEVSDCTDVTLLLVLPGSGDSLQGIKRGISEQADLVIVHKADGDRKPLALETVRSYREALSMMPDKKSETVIQYSSLNDEFRNSLIETLDVLDRDSLNMRENKRSIQNKKWFYSHLEEHISSLCRRGLMDQQIQNTINEHIDQKNPFSAFEKVSDMLSVDIRLNH